MEDKVAKGPPIIMSAPDGETHNVTDTFTIGRSASSDLVIDSKAASRQHAIIQRAGDEFLFRDLESSNGSWVSGKRVQQSVKLRHGSEIRIGSKKFKFCRGDVTEFLSWANASIGNTLMKFVVESGSSEKLAGLVQDSCGFRKEGSGTRFEEKNGLAKDGPNYPEKIRELLKSRLDQVGEINKELIGYVSSGLRDCVDLPGNAIINSRGIAEKAMHVVLRKEFPKGHIHGTWIKKWQQARVKISNECWQGRIPGSLGKRLGLLRVMTGTGAVSPVADYISKETFILLEFLTQVGQPGGHPGEEYFKTTTFALSVLFAAVELCEHLSRELG